MKIGFVATSILSLIVLLNACTKDRMPTLVELDNQLENSIQGKSPNGMLDFYVLPNENDLHLIPQDPKNPLTPQKVELGKLMYHDTGLGQDPIKEAGRGTYSCASCHVDRAVGVGGGSNIESTGEKFNCSSPSICVYVVDSRLNLHFIVCSVCCVVCCSFFCS